jgi:hypothetical protein
MAEDFADEELEGGQPLDSENEDIDEWREGDEITDAEEGFLKGFEEDNPEEEK